MSDLERWNDRYRTGDTPWDTGRPSSELQRVLAEHPLAPCQAVDLGCGTGVNAVWLAEQGFEVTGLDVSPRAIDKARARAAAAGVNCRFQVADLSDPSLTLPGPVDFVFDRGCYHVLRRTDVQAYLRSLERLSRSGTQALVLAGNAREPHDPGPPVVTEEQIRAELGTLFEMVQLREFYFDAHENVPVHFLAWSCLLRRP